MLFGAPAISDEHPQEVLDLAAGYDALAMKVRPLQDRVVVASQQADNGQFRPEGAPIRAQGDAPSTGDETGAERRVPERLRHKNRAATDAADLQARLAALEKRVLAERERIMQPEFGAGMRGRRPPPEEARKKLEGLQREFAELEREVDALNAPRAR